MFRNYYKNEKDILVGGIRKRAHFFIFVKFNYRYRDIINSKNRKLKLWNFSNVIVNHDFNNKTVNN
jgi:hypothetical protein